MEAFWSLALLQLLELPDHLNGSKIAERQCNEPEAAIDTRSSNKWCWDCLYPKAQAHSCCLNASQQRAVPDLVSRGVAEIRDAPVQDDVISSRSASIRKHTGAEGLPIDIVLDLIIRKYRLANDLDMNLGWRKLKSYHTDAHAFKHIQAESSTKGRLIGPV